jgi:hypothetical protein
MPYIVIVEKNGTLKEINIKEYKENDLFKKANFKSSDGFLLQTCWNVNIDQKTYNIVVYGKTNGKAGQENKYEFPPPIDSVLFFGGCVLVNRNDSVSISDLRISEWNIIYEKLMGGFEDIEEDEGDDENSEEEDIPNGVKVGKDGYVIDDFIVEEDEMDYDNISIEEEEEEEEEEEVFVKKQKKTTKNTCANKKQNKRKVDIKQSMPDDFLDCQSELSEEEYV